MSILGARRHKNFTETEIRSLLDIDHNGKIDLSDARKHEAIHSLSLDQFRMLTNVYEKYTKPQKNKIVPTLFDVNQIRPTPKKSPDEKIASGMLREFFGTKRKNIQFTPEYSYKKFFFTINTNIHSLNTVIEEAKIAEKILETSKDASVIFFIKNKKKQKQDLYDFLTKRVPGIKRFIDEGRLRFKTGKNTEDPWMQDIGEPTGGKRSEYLMGWPSSNMQEHKRERAPFDKSGAKEMGTRVTKIPAVLDGGDITKARSKDGSNTVIVGLLNSRDTWVKYSEYKYEISDDEIKKIYKHAFGADKVIMLSHGGQPTSILFHLDQLVFFPKDGTAVMIKPEPQKPSKKTQGISADEMEATFEILAEYKSQLEKEGFEVIEIPTTFKHMEKIQSYANAIPLRADKGTTVILPSYGDQPLEDKIKTILEKNGVKVIFIPNTTFERRGNTHCITGTLAFSDLQPRKSSSV